MGVSRKKLKSNEGNPTGRDTVRMERTIGLLGGISLILGMMIGSGVFIAPTTLLKYTGSAYLSLAVWTACGLLATLAALCYCELGTVVPRSGGEHAYYMATFSRHSKFFGELPAFLYAWITILVIRPGGIAVASLAFGRHALYPILNMSRYCREYQDEDEFKLAVQLLAVAVAVLIATVNCLSAKLATRAGIVFLVTKILASCIMIGLGVYNVIRGEIGALEGGWDPSKKSVGEIANSFYSGMFAYDGWNNLNFVTEELINPHRNLPLAIIIGIPLCTVLYILINISYFTALSVPEMLGSEAVAVDVGDKYLGPVKIIIPILVTIAAIGTGNGNMFTAGRITYTAGRAGHMVDVMSYIHATRLTPIVAIIVNVLLACVMIFISDIDMLFDIYGFSAWIIYGLAIGCVIILRFTEPDAPRPFRVPIILPVVGVLMSIGIVILPIAYDPKIEYLAVLGFFGLGVIVYIPLVYKKYRLPHMDVFTRAVQYVTLAAPSPYSED